MFAFSPPVKVARTQRSDVSVSVSANTSYVSARAAAAGMLQVHPASMEDAAIRTGPTELVAPTVFLSGAGRHMCWLVDENARLLRVWNLANAAWRRTQPRMGEIPFFAAAREGLPLFVAEMDVAEESLAFCSERGAVSTLDHSVELQVLDGDDTVVASCFACSRRADCGEVIVTAIGTTGGVMVVDVKVDGEHHTMEFDRATSPVRYLNAEPTSPGKPLRASGGGNSWWSAIKSLVGGGGSTSNNNNRGSQMYESENDSCGASYSVASEDSFSFTHLVIRQQYADELVAANAASEVYMLEYGPFGSREAHVRARWCTNIQRSLNRAGSIVCVAESRHKVWVLFLTEPRSEAELPALILVSLASSAGQVVNYVVINTISDVVHAARDTPRQHIRMYVDDSRISAIIFIRHFCVRVNNQVGVRNPCASEDTIVLEGMSHVYGSVLLPDDSVVSLGPDGPVVTVESVYERHARGAGGSNGAVVPETSRLRRAFLGDAEDDVDAGRLLASIVASVKVDERLSLDSAVLGTSEDMATEHTLHSGNWARADLNSEDENIILHVTRQLRRRQQSHRRFVAAILESGEEGVLGMLCASTVAQLISTQEALLGLVALRSLQNVGSIAEASSDAFAAFPRPFAVFGMTPSAPVKVVQSAAHMERCQRMLRYCVMEVARAIRERLGDAAAEATAAELVFANAANLPSLLSAAAKYLVDAQGSAALPSDEKFADAYTVACLHVIVAQTTAESRDDMRKYYKMNRRVRSLLWTASGGVATSLDFDFSFICVTLSNALAATVENAPRNASGDDGVAAVTKQKTVFPSSSNSITTRDQCELLDLTAYLEYFAFSNHHSAGSEEAHTSGAQARDYYSAALMRTLLRAPLVTTPFGYPYSAPRAPHYCPELGRRILNVCEALALLFDAVDVLLAMSLASPVEDPLEEEHNATGTYAKLRDFCVANPHMYGFALEGLWRSGREWELLCLPSITPAVPAATAVRDAFLEEHAPHLLWLAAPQRFDALIQEGRQVPLSNQTVAYSTDQLSHCCRSLAIARLAWVAAGAPEGGRYNELELAAACTAAQRDHLLPDYASTVLGPQELVQRLVAKESVEAWVAAASVASQTHEALSEDLLVQIIRRCRAYDADSLMRILRDGVSEREVADGLMRTATGRAIMAAAPLQERAVLTRICETVLAAEELNLMASWLTAFWSGSA